MQITTISDPPQTGAQNMAKDCLLLEKAEPVLRFYSWKPACVSVGYFQSIEDDIDTDFCTENNIDIVRRPTGGRAVLHDDELTYSIVLPQDMLPAGVIPSYKRIADIFVSALGELGIKAEVRGPEGRGGGSGICFAESSAYEISVNGKKLIGSAQLRRNGVILQHGSILLSVDYDKHSRCMKGRRRVPAEKLRKRMIGMKEACPSMPDIPGIIDIFSRHVSRSFET